MFHIGILFSHRKDEDEDIQVKNTVAEAHYFNRKLNTLVSLVLSNQFSELINLSVCGGAGSAAQHTANI